MRKARLTAIVAFLFPTKKREEELLARYQMEDGARSSVKPAEEPAAVGAIAP